MGRLLKAQDAYRKKDLRKSKRAHTKHAIREKDVHGIGNSKYVGDFVLGGLDGIITTFAVVSGVAGAALDIGVVLILGFANLIADGISMAVGNYLGTKSEMEFFRRERRREEWEIENLPEGEREEIRQIFGEKGFKGKDLENAVRIITSNKKVWVDTMMKDELGIMEDKKNPFMSGFITFGAFVIFGLLPLLAYVFAFFYGIYQNLFLIASIITAITLFLLGSGKVYVTGRNWFRSGLEMLTVGGLAAIAAYVIGFLLKGLA